MVTDFVCKLDQTKSIVFFEKQLFQMKSNQLNNSHASAFSTLAYSILPKMLFFITGSPILADQL